MNQSGLLWQTVEVITNLESLSDISAYQSEIMINTPVVESASLYSNRFSK